ncbi:MAG: hypothetical protein WC889_08470, partial [Myxococcota bacterium]
MTTFDYVMPGIVPNSVEVKGKVKRGEQVTASFKTTKPIQGNKLSVYITNGTDEKTYLTCIASEGNTSFDCTGTSPQSGSSPYYSVIVLMTDDAGNFASNSIGVTEIDNVPPNLASFQIVPTAAKLNETITVMVTADETLGKIPVISAQTVKEGITYSLNFTVRPNPLGKISYTYDSQLINEDIKDGIYSFLDFTLEDEAGNSIVIPGPKDAFTIDNIPPKITKIETDRPRYSKVSPYDKVTIKIACSKDLDVFGAMLTVSVGGEAVTSCSAYQKDTWPNYTCTYDIKTTDTTGVKELFVQAKDGTGNMGYGTASTFFDFTPPTIQASSGSPNPAGKGAEFVYMMTAGEDLASDPVPVSIPALTFSLVTKSANTYTWKHDVATTDTSNPAYTISFALTDTVGNAATVSGTGFAIDVAAPVITAVSVASNNSKDTTLAKNGNTITAVYKVNKTPGSDPVVRIGGKDMFCTGPTGAVPNLQYSCTYTTTTSGGTPDTDGYKSVSVNLVDKAGNSASKDIGGVTYDFIIPTLSMTVEPQARPGRAMEKIIITVVASESLDSSGVVLVHTGLTLTAQPPAGNTYVWTHTVTDTEPNQKYPLSATATDKAGNTTAGTTTGEAWVDGIKPGLTGDPTLNKTSGIYKAGEKIAVTFTANKSLGTKIPTALLNTTIPIDLPCATTGTLNQYKCEMVTALDGHELPESLVLISIAMQDEAGNNGYAGVNAALDFTPPSVSSSSGTPDPAGIGFTLTYTMSPSEELSTTPVITTTPALTFGAPTKSGNTYTWTRAITGAESS